jgi:predicted aconitase with swiveling domain
VSAERILRCHTGIGPRVQGKAIAAHDNFSVRYDLDYRRGIFGRPEHALHGMSYVGLILVLNAAKGGVASAWMLQELVTIGKAPLALVLNNANPVLVQGAAFANLPLVDRFDIDVTRAIATGDELIVDPQAGEVRVLRATFHRETA